MVAENEADKEICSVKFDFRKLKINESDERLEMVGICSYEILLYSRRKGKEKPHFKKKEDGVPVLFTAPWPSASPKPSSEIRSKMKPNRPHLEGSVGVSQPGRAIQNESVSPALPADGEIPYGAAWSGSGSKIAWGNRDDGGASINADHSFEHTFQLDELSFGDDVSPDDEDNSQFQRAKPERPDARLQPDGPDAIQVRRGDKLLSKIQLQPTEQGRLTCMSVLPGNRAVIGTSSGLYLYDILTGKLLRTFFGHRGTIHTVSPSPDGRWVLTTCDDKTLRIWSSGSDEPLLSLFFKGSQWIAWTPEGYYACSPGGERLIGWKFVPEKNGEPQYYPASFFHKTLYRPDVISRLLKEGSLDKALQEADGEAGRDTIKTAADEILPPLVTIQSPETDSYSDKSEITVRASAKSPGGQPIHSMKLLVNGRPFRGKAGEIEFDPTEVEPTASWTIPLENGRTSLQVLASSTVSQGTSAEVNVSYASPARPGVEDFLPRLYVVAVGISAYQSEELRLNYAAQDAEAISKAFETHSKPLFRSIEVRKLTDGEATADNIRKAFSWLKANVTQRDVAVFYFSGHGEKDNDGTLYFLPADADPDDLFSSAIPSEVLTRGLGSCPGRVLLMLDACHAGGIEATNRRKGGLTDDLVRDLVRDESGMVVMCSSTGKEPSVESNLLKMGTFTAAVVEGMSGLRIDTGKPSDVLSADDGTVYLHHLDAYVTDRVKELTGGKQRPVTDKPATISSFPLTQPDQGK